VWAEDLIRRLEAELRTDRSLNSAVALFIVLTLSAPSAFPAFGDIEWSWISRSTIGADQAAGDKLSTTPATPSIVLSVPPGRVEGFGPLATTLDFTVNGRVSPQGRTLGAGAEISAVENRWDERNPPLDPGRKIGQAHVHSSLTDSVQVLSPTAMLAAGFGTNFITMNVRASALDGILTLPLFSSAAGGAGFAEVKLDLLIFESLPGGRLALRYERNFAKLLASADNDTFFELDSRLDPDPLGGRSFPLQNGRDFVIRMSLITNVLLSGDAYPANAPPAISARSRFNSTFTFGGFFDFQDENGAPLNDVTFTSEAGIDWLSPLAGGTTVVPLPGSLALLAAGVPLLILRARRTKRRA